MELILILVKYIFSLGILVGRIWGQSESISSVTTDNNAFIVVTVTEEPTDFTIEDTDLADVTESYNDSEVTSLPRSSVDPLDCDRVWQLEEKWGVDFGEGLDCMMFRFNPDYSYLAETVDIDCMFCRCYGICPGDTEEEKEAAYDRWAAEIVHVAWSDHDVATMTIYCTIMVAGTIGNLLVIVTVVVIFIRPISVTNMFIASLAVADLLVCSVVVPFQVYLLLNDSFWKLSAELCKMLYYLYYAFFMASIFSLTAMSLERFFVICYPMKAQYMSTPKRAKVIIAIIWPLAFAMASPVAVQTDKYRGECEIRRRGAEDDWAGPLYLFISCVVFAIPAIIMGYAYIRTSMALMKSIKKVKDMKNEKDQEKKKESKDVRSRLAVIRMLITVWIVFVVCWTPFLVLVLLDNYAEDWLSSQMNTETFNYVHPTFILVTMANSALNPLLYAFMSKKFRRGFMKCFLCCFEFARTKTTSTTDFSSGVSRTRATTVNTVAATVTEAKKG